MDPQAMRPFGKALLAYLDGELNAVAVIRRDDGRATEIPVRFFFREPDDFTLIEKAALERCRGRVLDIGAGSGLHSLPLQLRGVPLTALDVCDDAVKVMRRRGLRNVVTGDILEHTGERYDTLLLLGHGIGLVEDLDGLDRFLRRTRTLLNPKGQLLLDSVDVRMSRDPGDLAYHQANQQAGRYVGEIRMQFEFRGEVSPTFPWLHVDHATLTKHAEAAGWRAELVRREASGEHLTRLTVV